MTESHPTPRGNRFVDMIGKDFDRLTVESYFGRTKDGSSIWNCRCKCGALTQVVTRNLQSRRTRSCGCLNQEVRSAIRTKHGAAKVGQETRTYSAWIGMKRRCYDSTDRSYRDYGGRGITVCEEWRYDFAAFLRDMRECQEGLTLDRYPNNDGNYEPGNARWATAIEQQNNRRNNHFVTHNNETLTLAQWSRKLGIDYKRFSYLVNHGRNPFLP